MKFRIVSALVSSVLVAGGIAALPSFADDTAATTTTVPVGGAVVTVKAPGMGGDMDENMIDYQGMSGMWMPSVREPVIPGVVISQDVLADRALVKTPYGYVSIPTGAGATVLYNDHFVNWQMAAPGAVVQLPMSEVVNGPVPHRLASGMVINDGYMPGSYRYMHSHMDGDMDNGMGMNGGGMNGGMNGGMSGGGMSGGGMSDGGMGMGRHHGRHGRNGGGMSGGMTGGTGTTGTGGTGTGTGNGAAGATGGATQ